MKQPDNHKELGAILKMDYENEDGSPPRYGVVVYSTLLNEVHINATDGGFYRSIDEFKNNFNCEVVVIPRSEAESFIKEEDALYDKPELGDFYKEQY